MAVGGWTPLVTRRPNLPLEYELLYRTGVFIRKCLDNENKIVSNVTRNGIFFQRMKSPIRRNAQCWSNFVGHSVHKMPVVNKKFVFQRAYDSLPTSYSNESVCSENCFVCVTDIAPRLCLSCTKWILLYNFYACSIVYILFFFILLLCTYARRSY